MLFSSVAGTSHHGRLYVPVNDRTLSKAHYRSTFPGEAAGLNERYALFSAAIANFRQAEIEAMQ